MCNFNIIFIAGTHGVGKGYLCSQIENNIGLPNFSASALIREIKQSDVDIDKKVIDPDSNQDYLVKALRILNTSSKTIVLDGHFCLYDGIEIVEIGIDVFKAIPLKGIIILFDTVRTINERLLARDGKSLGIDIIQELQNKEIEQGEITAKNLNIPLLKISSTESSEILKWINQLMISTF